MTRSYYRKERAAVAHKPENSVCTDLFVSKCLEYTAKNATDLVQVVDFTSLMHFANKLYQAC